MDSNSSLRYIDDRLGYIATSTLQTPEGARGRTAYLRNLRDALRRGMDVSGANAWACGRIEPGAYGWQARVAARDESHAFLLTMCGIPVPPQMVAA